MEYTENRERNDQHSTESGKDHNKEHITINSKSLARIGAIQALYTNDIVRDSVDVDPDVLIAQVKEYYKSSRKLKEDFDLTDDQYLKANVDEGLLAMFIRYSIVNMELIDSLITEHLVEPWSIGKLHPLLRSILRVAVSELKFFPDTSYKIVINDFVNIATEMLSSAGEINFANAILDKVYRQLSIKKEAIEKDLSQDV